MSMRVRLVWSACLLLAWGSVHPVQSSAPLQAFTVSGRVVAADGRPVRNVVLWIGGESDGAFSAGMCEVNADGMFVSEDVVPGIYSLDATAPSTESDPARGLAGFASVTVKDADVADVVVTLHRAATVTGHVKFESARDVNARHPRVTIQGVLAVERMRQNHSTVADAAEDGTFALGSLHGPRLIRADADRGSSPAPWWLQAVLLDGVDVTNVPIDFSSKPSARLEVVFSDRPTAVVGVVHDEAGLPVEGARVLVFSKDASMWAAWSTAVQSGVSDENGRFWFVDAMPAGDYRAIALRENGPQSIAEAVDELPRLEKSAMPIVVGESKVARIELIISRRR
jgi:hypothetical protein